MHNNFDLADNLFLAPKHSDLVGRKRSKIIDAPLMMWMKEWEDNPAKFLTRIQGISDYMLLNGAGLYDNENPNHEGLFDVCNGKLNPKDYEAAEYAFGWKGNTPIRDNHFFYPFKSHTLGEIVKQPFKYSCKNISNQYTNKKLNTDKETAKRLIKSVLAASVQSETGDNVDFLQDKKMNLQGGNTDAILDRLFGQERLQMIIFKLLQHINYEHDLLNLAKKAFEHKFVVNSEFGFVDVVDGEVIPKILHPSQVRWISGKPIETLEDPSVTAASFVNYLTFNEVINKYKYRLNTGTGVGGLVDAVDKLRSGLDCEYNPTYPYFSQYYKADVLTTDATNYNENFPRVMAQSQWTNIFYPYRKSPYGAGTSILEQKIFFKVQKAKRFIVEMNGKATNAREFEEWKTRNFDRSLVATFIELEDGDKAPKGQYVVDKWKEELWEATRIGHGTLIDVGRYKYDLTKKGNSSYVGMPIIAQISREKSMVLIGENIARWVNVLYQRIEEIINQSGLSTAIMIDETILSGPQAKAQLYNAKKTGIIMFNSSAMRGNDKMTAEHLSTLKMGNHVEELNNLFAIIGMLTNSYAMIAGTSDQVMGAGSPYLSAGQQNQNINNQNQLKEEKFWEHSKFMNQFLQRIADHVKYVYAEDGFKNIVTEKGDREVLKLTRETALADFDIFLESGKQLKDKKAIMDATIMQVMASGGIEMFEPLIKMLYEEDPAAALEIFRSVKDEMQALKAQADQREMEIAQMNMQTAQEKNRIPVEVAQVHRDSAITVQDMKNQEQRERENFKGILNDIDEVNSRERKILETDLRKDEQTHKRALESETI